MKPIINSLQLTPHFNLREFQCSCCQQVKLWPPLVECLEKLRSLWQEPIVLTSGYRCLNHNKRVGGVANSLHVEGRAADVVVMHRYQPLFCELAERAGFTSILPYGKRNFIHLAIKNSRRHNE
ncbi:MAG: D-Ala-D-Ala carboxypeptidase family metallohydrolase [Aminobacterium colombiense]|nr:D-Ala-D-Ala carboxypeptidase family metallohydrolase [Aminobacterium colombiense]